MNYHEISDELLLFYYSNYNQMARQIDDALIQRRQTHTTLLKACEASKQQRITLETQLQEKTEQVSSTLQALAKVRQHIQETTSLAQLSLMHELAATLISHNHDLEGYQVELSKVNAQLDNYNIQLQKARMPIKEYAESKQQLEHELQAITRVMRTRHLSLSDPPQPLGARFTPARAASAEAQSACEEKGASRVTRPPLARNYVESVQENLEVILTQINHEARHATRTRTNHSSKFITDLEAILANKQVHAMRLNLDALTTAGKASRLDTLHSKESLKQIEVYEQRMLRIMLLGELARKKFISSNEIQIVQLLAYPGKSLIASKSKNMIKYECEQAFAKLLFEVLEKINLSKPTKKLSSYQDLKQFIDSYKEQAKAQVLGLSSSHLEILAVIVQLRTHLISQVKTHLRETYHTAKLPSSDSHQAICDSQVQQIADFTVNQHLSTCLKTYRTDQRTLELKLEQAYHQISAQDFNRRILSCAVEIWTRQQAFYHKWKTKVKAINAQGFGHGQAVVGAGVCYAKSIHVMARSIENPDAPIETIMLTDISSRVRFDQANYRISTLLDKHDSMLPKDLPIEGLITECSTVFQARDIAPSLLTSLMAATEKQLHIAESGPSPHVALLEVLFKDGRGHAADIRCDNSRRKFWFHEPNFGTFELDSRAELAACISECLIHLYGDDIARTAIKLPVLKKASPALSARLVV